MRRIMWIGVLAFLGCGLVTSCDRDTSPRQIGRAAPVFAISDGQHSVDLAKLRGKVVILNFWASWCAPCLEEMPSLEALQSEMPQIQVVSIASDENFTTYQNFVAQHHVAVMTVFDQKQTSNTLYGSFRFPETYVIDKQGVIRMKLIGPQNFTNSVFVKYLKKLSS